MESSALAVTKRSPLSEKSRELMASVLSLNTLPICREDASIGVSLGMLVSEEVHLVGW